MKFGLDKTAVAQIVNGKLSGHNIGLIVGITDTIKRLEPRQIYKYLNVDERTGIQHSTVQKRLHHKYFHKAKMVP